MKNSLKPHQDFMRFKIYSYMRHVVVLLTFFLLFGFFTYKLIVFVKETYAVVGDLDIVGSATTIEVLSTKTGSLTLDTTACKNLQGVPRPLLKAASTIGGIDCDTSITIAAAGALTAGTYNGQTISSASNLTGSLTVASGLTVSAGAITLPDNSIASADVNFNYAAAASKGGAATDLSCTNCVALTTETAGNYIATITGNGQVGVAGSGAENAAATLSIVADSIGDTQLAYNTGQHLTTTNAPTFAGGTFTSTVNMADTKYLFMGDASAGNYFGSNGTYLTMYNGGASGLSFYVQQSIPITYIYSPNIFFGLAAGGTSIHTRGSTVNFGETGNIGVENFYMSSAERLNFFYSNGSTATQVGDISASDASWFRINQNTVKNIFTPQYIRADSGLFVKSTSYGISSNGILLNGSLSGTYSNALTLSSASNAYSGASLAVSGNITSSAGDLTISGGNISITNNAGGVDFNDANSYWLRTATNHGLYWDTTNNTWEWHSAGVDKWRVDLSGNTVQAGDLTVSGTGNSSFAGNVYLTGNVAVAGMSAIPATYNNTNILPNPSFEVATSTNYDGWAGSASGGTVTRTSNGISNHDGAYGMELNVTTAGTGPTNINSTRQPISPSTTYTLSTWAKVNTACGDGFHLRAYWMNAAGAYISVSDPYSNSGAVTTSWNLYKGNVTSPATAYSVRIYIYNNLPTNACTLYVDQVSFRPMIDADVLVNGNVGIGTTVPADKLHTTGSIRVNGAIANGLKFTSNGTTSSDHLLTTRGGTSWLYLRNWADDTYKNLAVGTLYGATSITVPGTSDSYIMGDVGIGTTAPANKLHVNGNISLSTNIKFTGGVPTLETAFDDFIFKMDTDATSGNGRFGFFQGATEMVVFKGSGNVGIGTTAPANKLHVNGQIRWYGRSYVDFTNNYMDQASPYIEVRNGFTGGLFGITAYASSLRFKKNITPLEVDSNKIYDLRLVSFNWKSQEDGQIKAMGMIAEEVDKILPQVVAYDKEGPHHIDYGLLSVLTIKELKKLNHDIGLTSTGDIHMIEDSNGGYDLKTKDDTFFTRIGAFAELVAAKMQAGVIETKKLLINGVDLMKKITDLENHNDALQQQVDKLKQENTALKNQQTNLEKRLEVLEQKIRN